MKLIVPEEILQATRMNEGDLRREIAVMLFERDKLSLGKASEWAGMSRLDFQLLLASRHISVHYGVDDFEDDLQTLNSIRPE